MSIRGYSAIGVDGIKDAVNAGSVLRAAGCYGASLVVFGGRRIKRGDMVTDTGKVWKHKPAVSVDDVMDAIPVGANPVAVDLIGGATPLHEFKHPESAFYIFGGEDRTLGRRVTDSCFATVYVPTLGCMNLAATVNVVLYDRAVKRGFLAPASLGYRGLREVAA
ncbi:TrmH family RNA methyltransferase [Henriciella aquimarina]|uniref:TrmH family RNA methyltransferase n=1 Tax=Henriciella aquimarina TaxID=545261 RepID=UPI000A05D6DC|nr:TrmH family RNA methyltransferase [Henriciella aquimarina]